MKKNILKHNKKRRRYNSLTVISFEILYSICIFWVLILFMGIMTINTSIIYRVIITSIFCIVYLVFNLFEITYLTIISDMTFSKKKIKLSNGFNIAINCFDELLKNNDIKTIPISIFLTMVIRFPVIANLILFLYFNNNMNLKIVNISSLIIILVAIFIILVLLTPILFVPYYMILEKKLYKEAHKSSFRLENKTYFNNVINMVLIQLVLFTILFVMILCKPYTIKNLKVLINLSAIDFNFLIYSFYFILFIVFLVFSKIILYHTISTLFYKNKKNNKEKIVHFEVKKNIEKNYNNKRKYVYLASSLVITIICSIILNPNIKKSYALSVDEHRIEVTAHRGASYYYPENTMASLLGAVKIGADWIEIDIHQTKDKKLVLLHDDSLFRTAGVERNIFDVNYNEIKELDVGSFFNSSYQNEKIPLLEDAIKFAKKNNVKLNIELKPTGNESDFEQSVINLIDKYDFEKNCIITSSCYPQLENIKKINKDISTGYIILYPIVDVSNLEFADTMIVEVNGINYDLVSKIHKSGKKINVWVVNDEDQISQAINMGVDNIISDHVELAKEIVDAENNHIKKESN